jgi:hypothetical protein
MQQHSACLKFFDEEEAQQKKKKFLFFNCFFLVKFVEQSRGTVRVSTTRESQFLKAT